MKNFDFNFRDCKSYDDIDKVIKKNLEYEVVVFDDDEAEEYFHDCFVDDFLVHHNTILSRTLNIWNDEYQGEEFFGVMVREHYIDSGSIDYVYSYNIVNM